MKTKGKQPAALLVVATKDPKDFRSKELALFVDDNGNQHITNASFKTHANPATGEEVDGDEGTPVNVTISEEKAVCITCANCKVGLVMPVEQASVRDELTCVACGTNIKYDPAAMGGDAAPEANDAAETAEDKPKTETAKVKDKAKPKAETAGEGDLPEDEDEDEDDIDLEEEVEDTGIENDVEDVVDEVEGEEPVDPEAEDEDDFSGDDEDEEDLDEEEASMADTHLIDLVDPDSEVAFVTTTDGRVLAMVGDVVVAKIDAGDADVDYDRTATAGYKRAFNRAVATAGLERSLDDAGFELINISAPATLAAARRSDETRVTAAADQVAHERMSKLRDCINLAVAGSTVGFFAKKDRPGVAALSETLAKALGDAGSRNPKAVTRRVLATALPLYLKDVLLTASELADKPDAAIEAIREQIQDVDTTVLNVETDDKPVETATFDDELELPARKPRPQDVSTKAKTVAAMDPEDLVSGLFTR